MNNVIPVIIINTVYLARSLVKSLNNEIFHKILRQHDYINVKLYLFYILIKITKNFAIRPNNGQREFFIIEIALFV